MAHLRKLEMKRTDYVKTEKAKKEVEKLESQMMVASQAIETISAEIVKLRESELYPQLVNLVKGFVLYSFSQFIFTVLSLNILSMILSICFLLLRKVK